MKQRDLITKSLRRYPLNQDIRFVEAMESLIVNDVNLDQIQVDINNWWNSNRSFKEHSKDFIFGRVHSWNQSVFVTFTFQFEKSVKVSNSLFTQFETDLSKTIYKNAFKRNNKRCNYFAELEGGPNTSSRIHFHGIFELPKQESFDNFKSLVQENWMHGNVDVISIDKNDTDSYIGYLLKSRSKSSPFLLGHL